MNDDAYSIWRARILARNRAMMLLGESTQQLRPKRSLAKEQRRAARKMTKATSQPYSMLNMGAPAGHVVLPRFPSERERTMFAAHERRKEAGWIRG